MGVATATAIVGVGLSAYQTMKAAKEKKDAARALEEMNRQPLENKAEGMQVSTLGSDLQKEQQSRLSAGQIDALRGAGTRGIIGGLGRVEEGSQRVNQGIAANLDEQQKEIDRLKLQEEQTIRGYQEQREIADISALSSQYNAANQAQATAMGNIIQGTGIAASNISNQNRTTTPQTDVNVNGFRANNINYEPITYNSKIR